MCYLEQWCSLLGWSDPRSIVFGKEQLMQYQKVTQNATPEWRKESYVVYGFTSSLRQ